MLPLELDCHTSRAITGRTVLFGSLSRLHRPINGDDFHRRQYTFPLCDGAFLPIALV
jgi:hypothetical protein